MALALLANAFVLLNLIERAVNGTVRDQDGGRVSPPVLPFSGQRSV